MTALASRPPAPASSARRELPVNSWDPLIRPFAWGFLVLGLFLNAEAIGGMTAFAIPNTVPLLVGMASIGLAVLVHRPETVVVPVCASTLVIMAFLSYLWSHNPEATMFWLRSAGMVMVGICALALVLPNDEVVRCLKWAVWLVLAVTLVAVAIDPLARIHIDPTGEAPPLDGWHGYFLHKNVMTAFLGFALPTVLAFDRGVTRVLSLAAIVFLLAVSDSTTGRSGALVVLAVWLWLLFRRRFTGRSSIAYSFSTFALVGFIGAMIANSLAAIADAAGKDLTFTGRTQIWSATWEAVGDAPIVGHAVWGLFRPPLSPATQEVMRAIGFKAGHPHNGLLDVAVQLGAVGVVLVIALIALIFRTSSSLLGRAPKVSMWATAVMTGIVVMSVGESTFLGTTIAYYFILHVVTLRAARATGLLRRHGDAPPSRTRRSRMPTARS